MSTVISVRTDKHVKNAAQQIAKDAGFSLSALINAYLRQLVATRRINFYAPEPMTPQLEELIKEVEAEIETGKVSKKFKDAESFLADLKK